MRKLSNSPIVEIPKFRALPPLRSHPRFLLLILIQRAVIFAVGVIAGVTWGVFNSIEPSFWVQYWWGGGLLLAVFLGLGALYYTHLGYVAREHDLSVYSGILFRRIVVQPFSRLQHIEITRGPLERSFGLASLKLFSAGGAAHSLAVRGLSVEDAEGLRAYILDSQGLKHEQ